MGLKHMKQFTKNNYKHKHMTKRTEREASQEEDVAQGSLLDGEKKVTRSLEQLRCEGNDYEKLINSSGFPHCVQCRAGPEETTKVLRVSYDYEMLYDDTEDPDADIATDILPRFEWGLMDQVESQFFLRGCQMWRQEYTDKFTVTGLSSLYLDFRDINVDDCEFMGNPFLKCIPVAGSMTLEYFGDVDPQEVEEALLKEINIVMSENRGTGGRVKSVLYLGNRQEYRQSRGASFAASAAEDDRAAVRTTSIATSASAIMLILVLIGAALYVWRGKSEKRRAIDISPIDLESPPESVHVFTLDHELPSTPERRKEKAPSSSRDGSADLSECIEDQADDMSDAAVADPVEEHPPILPPPPITRTRTPPEIATFTSLGSSDDSATAVDGAIVAAAAVPPPKDAKSETLKKKRKKKKKKFKKVTLVRVNSRENISSMETISETDEQEQQDNLDEDLKRPSGPVATYSTSDDESSAYSTSSDNEQDFEQEVVHSASRSPGRSRHRGDLPPLPPVEF